MTAFRANPAGRYWQPTESAKSRIRAKFGARGYAVYDFGLYMESRCRIAANFCPKQHFDSKQYHRTNFLRARAEQRLTRSTQS